jgi:hypothetical protein
MWKRKVECTDHSLRYGKANRDRVGDPGSPGRISEIWIQAVVREDIDNHGLPCQGGV